MFERCPKNHYHVVIIVVGDLLLVAKLAWFVSLVKGYNSQPLRMETTAKAYCPELNRTILQPQNL